MDDEPTAAKMLSDLRKAAGVRKVKKRSSRRAVNALKQSMRRKAKKVKLVPVVDSFRVSTTFSKKVISINITFSVDEPTMSIIDVNNCYKCGVKTKFYRPLGFKFLTTEARRFKFLLNKCFEDTVSQSDFNQIKNFNYSASSLEISMEVPSHIYYYNNGKPKGLDCSNYFKIIEDVLSGVFIDDSYTDFISFRKFPMTKDDGLFDFTIKYTIT